MSVNIITASVPFAIFQIWSYRWTRAGGWGGILKCEQVILSAFIKAKPGIQEIIYNNLIFYRFVEKASNEQAKRACRCQHSGRLSRCKIQIFLCQPWWSFSKYIASDFRTSFYIFLCDAYTQAIYMRCAVRARKLSMNVGSGRPTVAARWIMKVVIAIEGRLKDDADDVLSLSHYAFSQSFKQRIGF